MCAAQGGQGEPPEPGSSPRDAWTNLRQPGPLGWKIRRFLANNGIKIVRRQSCCGHDGEPGC